MTNVRTRIPKINQGDKLMTIAKNRAINRNDLINHIIKGMANNLPDVKYLPDSNIQIIISNADDKDVEKITRYCNSINSSFGEELKRGIDDFIRRHQNHQTDHHHLNQ